MAGNAKISRFNHTVRLVLTPGTVIVGCPVPLLASANVMARITSGDESGSPFMPSRQQLWSPHMTVVWPLGRQYRPDGSQEGGVANLFWSIFVLSCMPFSPHGVSRVFCEVFFLAKVGQPGATPRTAGYLAQNYYSSLPRFVPNRVFRKILG